MARDRLGSRLMSRATGLVRKQMPGGGEAFSGPLANEALSALGARAMTMDSSIFVNSGFDASKGEDLALLAHEQHHQAESGGSDNHSLYDAEEQAARARERLVLHQSGAGHDPGDILAGLDGHDPKNDQEADDAFANMEQRAPEDGSGEPDPVEAYRNMLKDGMSHDMVVRDLSDYIVQTLERQDRENDLRTASDSKFG